MPRIQKFLPGGSWTEITLGTSFTGTNNARSDNLEEA